MLPQSSLLSIYKYVRFERLPSSAGIDPESWLLSRYKPVRFERFPSSAGMDPESWLSERYKTVTCKYVPSSSPQFITPSQLHGSLSWFQPSLFIQFAPFVVLKRSISALHSLGGMAVALQSVAAVARSIAPAVTKSIIVRTILRISRVGIMVFSLHELKIQNATEGLMSKNTRFGSLRSRQFRGRFYICSSPCGNSIFPTAIVAVSAKADINTIPGSDKFSNSW